MPTLNPDTGPTAGTNSVESSSSPIIRVFIVEDNRMLCDGIVTLLNRHDDISVAGSAACSMTALPAIREARPHVVLVDSGLADDDSEHLVQCIAKTVPEASVVVMDILPEKAEIDCFVRAGAAGFIIKDATMAQAANVIRSVAAGGRVVPNVTSTILAQVARQAAGRPLRSVVRAVVMTERERRIIAMIAEGANNKDIARRLHLSSPSIRGYVRNIVEKLALRASLEAEVEAVTHPLLPHSSDTPHVEPPLASG